MSIANFALERVKSMLARPGMWGGDEAVELQVLLLLDACEADLACPGRAPPRKVLDAYIRFSDKLMGDQKSTPLSARMREAGRADEFLAALGQFALGTWTLNNLGRRHRGDALTFGVDYDGTLAADPILFGKMIVDILERGHEVVVVTGRSDEGRWGDEVRATLADLGLDLPVVFASNGWKRRAAEAAGYKVDIWIDDHPEWIGPQDPQKAAARST